MTVGMRNLQLPSWAAAALVARCARRYAEAYSSETTEPAASRIAVAQAVALSEARAGLGGDRESFELVEIDGQFFDNYDVEAIAVALGGYVTAASNTLDDLHEDPDLEPQLQRTLASVRLALVALETAFPIDTRSGELLPISEVLDLALAGDPDVKPWVEADVQRLQTMFEQSDWTHATAVPATVFGPLC